MSDALVTAIWVAAFSAIFSIITKIIEIIVNWLFENRRIKIKETLNINKETEEIYSILLELIESFVLSLEEVLKLESKIFEVEDEIFNIDVYYKERFNHIQELKKINTDISVTINKLNFKLSLNKFTDDQRLKKNLDTIGELTDEITFTFKNQRNHNGFNDLDVFITDMDRSINDLKSKVKRFTDILIECRNRN